VNRSEVFLVVAVADNGVIGRDGGMPWHISADFRRVKSLTMGKPLVTGRKTFESVGGKPLPGRPHVIISRGPAIDVAGVETASSLEAGIERAIAIAEQAGVDEVCVVGGGEIYRQALPLADVLHVTHVEAVIDGDTVFPAIDPAVFEMVEEHAVPAGEKDSFATRYAVYRRRPAA